MKLDVAIYCDGKGAVVPDLDAGDQITITDTLGFLGTITYDGTTLTLSLLSTDMRSLDRTLAG